MNKNKAICRSRIQSSNKDLFVSDYSFFPSSPSQSNSSIDCSFSVQNNTKATIKNNLSKQEERLGRFESKKVISKSPLESPPPINGK